MAVPTNRNYYAEMVSFACSRGTRARSEARRPLTTGPISSIRQPHGTALIATTNPASSSATFAVIASLYQAYGPEKGGRHPEGFAQGKDRTHGVDGRNDHEVADRRTAHRFLHEYKRSGRPLPPGRSGGDQESLRRARSRSSMRWRSARLLLIQMRRSSSWNTHLGRTLNRISPRRVPIRCGRTSLNRRFAEARRSSSC
jgi:hypothetical protein